LLTTLAGKDFATQDTLAAILAKLSGDPSTATLQAAIRDRLPAALGRLAPAASLGVSLSTEDLEAIEAIATALGSGVTALSGTTDDAAMAGQLYALAALYVNAYEGTLIPSSVDEVDSGDAGRLRMTRRRALFTAADAMTLTETPTWAGSAGNGILQVLPSQNSGMVGYYPRLVMLNSALDQAARVRIWIYPWTPSGG